MKVTRVSHIARIGTPTTPLRLRKKTRFTALLSELCQNVPQPEQTKGRPRLPLADMVFAAGVKSPRQVVK